MQPQNFKNVYLSNSTVFGLLHHMNWSIFVETFLNLWSNGLTQIMLNTDSNSKPEKCFVVKLCWFPVLCTISQLVVGWKLEEGYQACGVRVTSANWYKGFSLNIRATADTLVEEAMTRTLQITYSKIVNGGEPELLKNNTDITVSFKGKSPWSRKGLLNFGFQLR